MKTLLFVCSLLLCLGITGCRQNEKELKITAYVNPFIGTDGHGHCFPGAILPFGGIQLSPDNPRNGWDWTSGYHYSDSIISSFSHTHLSGTGIGDLQDIRFLPVSTTPDTSISPAAYIQSGYARFSHRNEQAEPGYYSVVFDNGIKTELSVTNRCGIHYYQYPANSAHALTIDLTTARNWDRTTETSIRKVNNRTLEGYRKSQGWANDQRVYFIIEFSQDCEVLAGYKKFSPLENGQKITDKGCYLYVDFGQKTNKILAKISISSANTEGAIANLEKELSHWSFDKVKRDANHAWKRQLQKIKAEGRNEADLENFYTALYHAYTAPYLFSDVNGNYKGPDKEIHSVHKHNQYSVFSLWDTYRAAHPLFTITQKKRVSDMINSMLKHYDAYGLLPVWELAGNETFCMIGNHAIPVIVDAYLKGYKGFDPERAYEAIRKSSLESHPKSDWETYNQYGYYPFDLIPEESVSRTLESCYDDYCVAQMAKELGKKEDYNFFSKRARAYTSLFDPVTKLMRGKDSQGKWREPFDPFRLSHAGTSGGDYTEGNAWQYVWHVQHDVDSLIEMMGGNKAFTAKLDSLFWLENNTVNTGFVSDVTGLIGQYAHGNEPSHHVAYLYNYAGEFWKTQKLIREIFDHFYLPVSDGLCGNDDCGQMSAWYLFSAMGFYPVDPISKEYIIGAPQLKEMILRLEGGKNFIIRAEGLSEENKYVKAVFLNGKELKRFRIFHHEITDGGILEFIMTDNPSKSFN
mgnify:CR=1 FL=1